MEILRPALKLTGNISVEEFAIIFNVGLRLQSISGDGRWGAKQRALAHLGISFRPTFKLCRIS